MQEYVIFSNNHFQEIDFYFFAFLSIVPFDTIIKLQQEKFMKQLSLDLQTENITKHFHLKLDPHTFQTNLGYLLDRNSFKND